MKKLFSTFGLIAIGTIVFAQTAPPPPKMPRHGGFDRREPGFYKELNLTDEQKEKLKGVNKEYMEQLQELRKNEDITIREMKAKTEALRKDVEEKRSEIFTTEQKKQLDEQKKAGTLRMKEAMQQRDSRLKEELKLTDKQKQQFEAARENFTAKAQSLRENKSLSKEEKAKELKKLGEEHKAQLNTFLSEEQMQQLHKNKMEAAKKAMKHHRGDRKRGPKPPQQKPAAETTL